MKFNIALIGCGQLGRRHIQGLGLSSSEINVHVYDCAKKSLIAGADFVKDIAEGLTNLKISFYDNIPSLSSKISSFDLVIVSSTAQNRPANLIALTALIESKAWLLEKPICQSPDELRELVELTKDMKIWVNHVRRLVPWYRDLRSDYFAGQKINISFSGPNIGIACNISHHIDFVNFMTGELPVSVDTSGLSKQWHDAKRIGFKEITGVISCQFSNGSTMSVVSNNDLDGFKIKGELQLTGKKFVINETTCTIALDSDLIKVSHLPFQSQLTGKVFDQIKEKGKSDLTPFPLAADCYKIVISSLLNHWNSTTSGKIDRVVPLT